MIFEVSPTSRSLTNGKRSPSLYFNAEALSELQRALSSRSEYVDCGHHDPRLIWILDDPADVLKAAQVERSENVIAGEPIRVGEKSTDVPRQ